MESLTIDGEPDGKYADVVLARVGELAVSREIAAVKARLQRMNPVDEQAAYNRLSATWWAWETQESPA